MLARGRGEPVERGPPAQDGRDLVVGDDVVPVGRAGRRREHGGQVQVRHAQAGEVGHLARGVVEREVRVELEPVGGDGDRPPLAGAAARGARPLGRPFGRSVRHAHSPTGRVRTSVLRPVMSMLAPALHLPAGAQRVVRVEHAGPHLAVRLGRQGEGHRVGRGVVEEQEAVVDHLLAARVRLGDRLAVEEHGDRLGVAVVPVGVGHVLAGRGEPRDVVEVGLAAVLGAAREEAASTQHGVVAAQVDQRARELEVALRLLAEVPVHPRRGVVLAVPVVVAALGAAELVAVGEHRHTLREQQRGEEVALLAPAQLGDRRVVRRALGRRSSTSGCGSRRRRRPRRSPRCASRCRRRGRGA